MPILKIPLVVFQGCHPRFYSIGKGVRVRFAPSPTGYLHLGGLRTALYNFLFARVNNGKFVLRIEDTDQTRCFPDAVEQIQNDLEWINMTPDEGPKCGGPYGPYIQSERKEIYREEAERLISSGAAYYCFCTEKRLDLLRKDALRNRQVPKYDNHCRHLSKEEIKSKLLSNADRCVRFKLVQAEPFNDIVYGNTFHDVMEIEGDPIILKSDHWPTYHLANVVDDKYMEISHVIRGVEWMQSTSKHLMIYRALGYAAPQYAHLPLILNKNGTKLSKRQGDLSLKALRENGVLPNALINFLIQAGSGFKSTNKIVSLEELIADFNLNNVSTHSTKLPLERIDEFNRLELIEKINNTDELQSLVSDVKSLVQNGLSKRYRDENLQLDDDHIASILKLCLPRITSLRDLINEDLRFLWVKPDLKKLQIIHNGFLFRTLRQCIGKFGKRTEHY
ncbi:probable glutamate--tRNA ligase, mitochondrial isoform X2 [Cimex lectularius]|uniref:Nondiscriminating glutamyl-tRNA synthetase EARS2, mitochondrial n=1 Tax=Cimex lectularius TaxID=79782 RepID=A0A8I6SBM5_CIMLE|nr:probable glutamate--tRNA ligase, mitochondrial isoform X2 [Cimex lectularius]